MAFIAAGAGVGEGLARREAARVGGAPRACSGVARARQTRVRLFLPCSNACWGHKRANLTKGLVQDFFLAPRAS
jgi:hypothetical protein